VRATVRKRCITQEKRENIKSIKNFLKFLMPSSGIIGVRRGHPGLAASKRSPPQKVGSIMQRLWDKWALPVAGLIALILLGYSLYTAS
jgi:hypothetical protein